MSSITTHVLDVARGKPASGILVRLETRRDEDWVLIATNVTDSDGRCRDLAKDAGIGTYRLTFETAAYFRRQERSSIYPEIQICFDCINDPHYHLPLLLSDNSYTTYRGS